MCKLPFGKIFGPVLVALAILVMPRGADAQQCMDACAHGRALCAMQARTALAACMQGCSLRDDQCRSACIGAALAARATCRAARADCGTSCAMPPPRTPSCADACSVAGKACFAHGLAGGSTCLQNCKATGGAGPKGCLVQCAHAIGGSGATCLATFQSCLNGCQGPVAGACFSTVAMQCTTDPCGPDQPCAQAGEFCSERCATSSTSGTCLDLRTGQCSDRPCSAAQPCGSLGEACVAACPPPPPQGWCFDLATKACTDHACDAAHRCTVNQLCTLQCPPALPCTTEPCDGACVISPTCLPGQPCPAFPSRLGRCLPDAAGSCACVSASPRPTPTAEPTPTAQCGGAACGGPCTVGGGVSCPPGKICNGPLVPVRAGQCQVTSSGQCACVALSPTPRATPTPQCGSASCGGSCTFAPPCPSGGACPAIIALGHCGFVEDGSCACVPGVVATPTPGCATDADCTDDNGCTADRCVNGTCEHSCLCLNAAGARTCCPGPSALCVKPCGSDADGSCGGACPFGANCEAATSAGGPCACVSGPGGPCGGNVLTSPPVCAPGLVCRQSLPDVTGYCEKAGCIPLFTSGCADTSDCCQPCENGTHAPCGVCSNGICEGAP